jgi:hypothetical protein
MTEFEKVLAECLRELEQGVSSVDECLRRYPGHALQLEPVLLTVAYLQHGREARPSAAFNARVRAKLIQGMQTHPQKTISFDFMFMRPAASLLVIVLAFVITGTAYAQSALPGDTFYAWKLASENTWRAVSPDPVKTDLALANRRVDELIAVRDDPALHAEALQGYLEVTARLKSEMNAENEARILPALESQIEELNDAGIPVPQLDQNVPPQLGEPLPTPVETRLPVPEIPQVNPTSPAPTEPALLPELPPVIPTELPNIVPTVQAPPNIIPTDLIPTIDIPPLIP